MTKPVSKADWKDDIPSLEELPELKTVELPETVSHEYLVDLIDQPAWKTILLTIVRQEKMDPWNIDLILLADKYLDKINSLEKANLRVPANAMLASAILLKTKSKTLHITTLEELEKAEAKKELTPEERALLAVGIPELRGTRSMREGKVTLDELVKNIESMLSKSRNKNSFAKQLQEIQFVIPFSGMDIEKKMEEVMQLVQRRADSQGMVLFSQLMNGNRTPNEVINVFIPILFLANKGQLSIWQEEFWEEIFVQLNKPKEIGV
jgi:segregation and condensation protein A